MFALQKYQLDERETNYLALTNQLQSGYISPRLQELCGYYSNRMSYEEVALLVERVSGERLLSNQKIWQIVSTKALKVSQEIYKSMAAILARNDQNAIEVNPSINIYNPEEKEILLFDDGIQVKGQKAERQSKPRQEKKSKKLLEAKTPAIITDIVILREIGGGIIPPPTLSQKATAEFEYVAAPINADAEDLLSLTSVVKAKVSQEYGSQASALNLVAITDGARAIRHRLLTIFGVGVIVI